MGTVGEMSDLAQGRIAGSSLKRTRRAFFSSRASSANSACPPTVRTEIVLADTVASTAEGVANTKTANMIATRLIAAPTIQALPSGLIFSSGSGSPANISAQGFGEPAD